jgi:archaellum biogenesis protein FlaJ (TadC family)
MTRQNRDIAFFVALMATALALGGALAHLYELPNKIGLPRDSYFTVQAIYLGWWQLAFVLLVQFIAILAIILMSRHEARVFWLAIIALACLASAQAVFWIYTQPANAATQNWSIQPENWEALRRQWEYSHAVGAVFQLGAMAALILAVLTRRSFLERF